MSDIKLISVYLYIQTYKKKKKDVRMMWK